MSRLKGWIRAWLVRAIAGKLNGAMPAQTPAKIRPTFERPGVTARHGQQAKCASVSCAVTLQDAPSGWRMLYVSMLVLTFS